MTFLYGFEEETKGKAGGRSEHSYALQDGGEGKSSVTGIFP
jgi:hypothetical protein